MAYSDYGALIKKNGRLLNKDHEFFQNMKDCVGFEVKEVSHIDIKDEFFCYAGDKDLLLCCYKNIISFFSVTEDKILKRYFGLYDVNFNDLYRKIFEYRGAKIDIKRIQNGHDKFRLRMWYKGDLWEITYGYGINLKIDYCYGLNNKSKSYIEKWLEE